MKSKRHSIAWIAAGVALLATGPGRAGPSGFAPDAAYFSLGKPSAPIDMSYNLRDTPAAGVPLTIDVAVSSRVRADSLTLDTL